MADRDVTHRFFNDGDEPVRFEVLIEPGSPGFEKELYILYGLGLDGETDENGLPNDPHHSTVFVVLSDTQTRSLQGRILAPVLDRLAGWAQRLGIESEVMDRYYLNRPESLDENSTY